MKRYKSIIKEEKKFRVVEPLSGGFMQFTIKELSDGTEIIKIDHCDLGPYRTGGLKDPKKVVEKALHNFVKEITIDW